MTGDIADIGNERAQEFLDDAIAAVRRKASAIETGVGICLNCGAAVDGLRRWCDVDCRDDWEREQKRNALQRFNEEG